MSATFDETAHPETFAVREDSDGEYCGASLSRRDRATLPGSANRSPPRLQLRRHQPQALLFLGFTVAFGWAVLQPAP